MEASSYSPGTAEPLHREVVTDNGVRAKVIVSESVPMLQPDTPSSQLNSDCSDSEGITGAPALASVATLCNSAIGAGVLSLPFAFKMSGALGGLLLTFSIGMAEAFTMYVLSKMAEKYEAASYSSLVRKTLGKKSATFMAALLVVYMWGSCNAYVVIMADVFEALASSYLGEDSVFASRTYLILGFGFLVLLPLCFIKQISKLAFLSSVAVTGFLYTALVVLKTAVEQVETRGEKWEDITLIRTDIGILYALPIIVFGFNCHANTVPIFHELTEEPEQQLLPVRTKGRKTSKLINMITVIMAAIAIIMFGYLVVGIAGYFAYPDLETGNILNMLPADDPWVQAARLLIGIVVIGHYPLNHHPARAGALDLAALGGMAESSIHGWYSTSFTVVFTLSSVVVSIFCKDLGDVIHIIGGTTAACLIFFMPGFMLMNQAIIKHSEQKLQAISSRQQSLKHSEALLQEPGSTLAADAAADALHVPLLQVAVEKGIKKTGLVYSPRKSWAVGLVLVMFAVFIFTITIVTAFIGHPQ